MSVGKIYSLIPKVMAEVGAIEKLGENKHQNYAFRGIEHLYNAVHPVFVRLGVFCAPEVLECTTSEHATSGGKASFRVLLKIKHRFFADDGSSVEVTTMGEGIDTSDKASNKAMSAAMKYAFVELLSIPTEDIEDSDRGGQEGDGKPPAQEYVVPFGKKFKGMTLNQIYNSHGPYDIAGYIKYLEENSKKTKTPMGPDAEEFIRHAEVFLGALERRPPEGSNG